MAKKSGAGSVVGLLVAGVVVVFAWPYISQMFKRRGPASGYGGGGGATSSTAAPLGRATPPSGAKPSGGSGMGGQSPTQQHPNVSASAPYRNISVAQALADGVYNGSTQNTLAGIFNVQMGAGDFAGNNFNTTLDNLGFAQGDTGYALDSFQFSPSDFGLSSSDLQMQTLDNLPVGDAYTGFSDPSATGYLGGYDPSVANYDSTALDAIQFDQFFGGAGGGIDNLGGGASYSFDQGGYSLDSYTIDSSSGADTMDLSSMWA